MTQFVAFSGGKDSTALALRMAELGEDFTLLFTPTGDELPELYLHITRVLELLGPRYPIVVPKGPRLAELMAAYNALPSWRMRWCTRQIKIEPCIAFLKQHPGSTLCVGLRADEPHREGLYGPYAVYRYPLREWGWGLKEVYLYLKERGVQVPKRTDCAMCYGQRLSEWYALWRDHPERYAAAETWEARTGHTFRSPQRDKWPAALAELRQRFEAGEMPRGVAAVDAAEQPCRVCRL